MTTVVSGVSPTYTSLGTAVYWPLVAMATSLHRHGAVSLWSLLLGATCKYVHQPLPYVGTIARRGGEHELQIGQPKQGGREGRETGGRARIGEGKMKGNGMRGQEAARRSKEKDVKPERVCKKEECKENLR